MEAVDPSHRAIVWTGVALAVAGALLWLAVTNAVQTPIALKLTNMGL